MLSSIVKLIGFCIEGPALLIPQPIVDRARHELRAFSTRHPYMHASMFGLPCLDFTSHLSAAQHSDCCKDRAAVRLSCDSRKIQKNGHDTQTTRHTARAHLEEQFLLIFDLRMGTWSKRTTHTARLCISDSTAATGRAMSPGEPLQNLPSNGRYRYEVAAVQHQCLVQNPSHSVTAGNMHISKIPCNLQTLFRYQKQQSRVYDMFCCIQLRIILSSHSSKHP